MHKDLTACFLNLVELLKNDLRCKGGWHYGSYGRGESDEYSDYDPVFLVAGCDFKEFALSIPSYLKNVCDELLIFWPENYNDDYFRNHCSIIRLGKNLHQLDFFMLNSDYPDKWFCRQHLKGCTRSNIIFDRQGEVAALLDRRMRTDNAIPDTLRTIDTYWFHVEMLIKYFKRKDIFKLIKNKEAIFQAHADLLLCQYDTLDWGAWETKVKKCVPKEKQLHLLEYHCPGDFNAIKLAVQKGILYFCTDATEACQLKEIAYPLHVQEQIVKYFNEQLRGDQKNPVYRGKDTE